MSKDKISKRSKILKRIYDIQKDYAVLESDMLDAIHAWQVDAAQMRNAAIAHSRESFVRTFYMLREKDVSGISGTGVVADGAIFPDGTTVIRWRGETPSTVVWQSFSAASVVHGHGGATRFVFQDDTGEDSGGAG